MGVISTDDFLSGSGQTSLMPADINDRIEFLKAEIREAQQNGEEPDDDAVAECDALIGFRADVESRGGGLFETARIVPDDLFEHYVEDYAVEIGLVDESMTSYVDWEKFGDAHKGDGWMALDFGDDLVYVKA